MVAGAAKADLLAAIARPQGRARIETNASNTYGWLNQSIARPQGRARIETANKACPRGRTLINRPASRPGAD